MDASQPSLIDAVLAAVTELREGAEPSVQVFKGSEELLCSLFCPKQLHTSQANTIWWHPFKQLKLDQGVDKLPTTRILWLEHIRRAHVQWSVWSQDLIVNSVVPDPVTLRCQMQYVKLLPLLTKETPAPGQFFNSFDATVGPLTSTQPASVHAGGLANDTILSAPNCAIVPEMTSVRTQSQS